jgi:hypothetical protein
MFSDIQMEIRVLTILSLLYQPCPRLLVSFFLFCENHFLMRESRARDACLSVFLSVNLRHVDQTFGTGIKLLGLISQTFSISDMSWHESERTVCSVVESILAATSFCIVKVAT